MRYYWIGLVVLLLLNIGVSIFLFKRDDLEPIQKVVQIIIVWLVPVLGAISMWLLNRSQDDDHNKPGSKPFGGGGHDSIGAQ